MTYQEYSDQQQAEFCEMAQERGIGRTMRELGFPKSYATAIKWMKSRGIKPNVDRAMQAAKEWHVFYEIEDLMEQIDTSLAVVQEMVITATTADEAKKLAEATQKLVNTRLLLEGKATSISENRKTTQQDLEIEEMLRVERARQAIGSAESLSESLTKDSGTSDRVE